MNEVFGKENHVATIPYVTATNQSGRLIPQIGNWILWFAKDKTETKYRQFITKNRQKRENPSQWSHTPYAVLADGSIRNLKKEERETQPAARRLKISPENATNRIRDKHNRKIPAI